jgi:hypothetical protein
MSKTTEKRAARLAEAAEFVRARRRAQLEIFESNFNVGVTMFLENKDKLNEEEIATIEAQMEQNQRMIDEYKAKYDL